LDQIQKLRVDKWLWQARLFKTRTLASKVVSSGQVRVNSKKVTKPSYMVTVKDVLNFAQEKRIRVVKIEVLGTRRGPATEAQELYLDMSPKEEPISNLLSYERMGRPSKKGRRSIDRLRSSRT
jgi:ribosome-associated heat shock protein Hsp15